MENIGICIGLHLIRYRILSKILLEEKKELQEILSKQIKIGIDIDLECEEHILDQCSYC